MDHSGQDSRVVLDGKGKPAVTVSIEGIVSIQSNTSNKLVKTQCNSVPFVFTAP